MKPISLVSVLVVFLLAGCAWLRPPTEPSAAFRRSGLEPGEGEGAVTTIADDARAQLFEQANREQIQQIQRSLPRR